MAAAPPTPLDRLRVFLARNVFSTLSGVGFGDWMRLLADNRFRVDPPHWGRAAAITLGTLPSTVWRAIENRRFAPRIASTDVKAPLFILGHWRGGTTHLHNLLAEDPQFAYASMFDVLFPHSFLSLELGKGWAALLSPTRHIDNVRLGWDVPYEDEFALCAATFRSPYLAWIFSRRYDHYQRYLTFRGVPNAEVAEWKAGLLHFARKLTLKYGRPLVLKSPPHTCRIKLLLEVFPDARFVHIHRDPYAVFQSTRRMVEVAGSLMKLQRLDAASLEARVLDRYVEMYDAFFEEKSLVPAGRFHELGFEALERDPAAELRRLYDTLGLGGFDAVAIRLQAYLDALRGYQKNVHEELPEALQAQVRQRWGRTFEEWGYPC